MIRHRMGTLVNRSFSPWRFISSCMNTWHNCLPHNRFCESWILDTRCCMLLHCASEAIAWFWPKHILCSALFCITFKPAFLGRCKYVHEISMNLYSMSEKIGLNDAICMHNTGLSCRDVTWWVPSSRSGLLHECSYISLWFTTSASGSCNKNVF